MIAYVYRVGIALSILLNALSGGRESQTFSARNYEWKRQDKFNIVRVIDRALGKGHCLDCWVKWYASSTVKRG